MGKELSKYDINILGLENRSHTYVFEGNNAFFQDFEQDIFEGGSFLANLVLEKNDSFIRVHFDINADLQLVCNRSLEIFSEKFEIKEKYIFKFGQQTEEVNEEMEVITYGTHKINVAQLIYEYILLAVPVKNLHPRFRNEESTDGVMVYTDPAAEKEQQESTEDPRWAALINLKNK